jgi:hypothetical protein
MGENQLWECEERVESIYINEICNDRNKRNGSRKALSSSKKREANVVHV